MKRLISIFAVVIVAASLTGCLGEEQYICVGEEVTSDYRSPDTGVKRSTVKMVVYTITIKDKFIFVAAKNNSKDVFDSGFITDDGWIKIVSKQSYMPFEVRAFHPGVNIFDFSHSNFEFNQITRFKGECKLTQVSGKLKALIGE